MHFQVLALLALTIGAQCMGRPQRTQKATTPFLVGGVVEVNGDKYMDLMWRVIPQIETGPKNILIPLKVTKASEQLVSGVKKDLEVLVVESTCAVGGSVAINETNCKPKEDGQRSLQTVNIFSCWWRRQYSVSINKVRNVEDSETF